MEKIISKALFYSFFFLIDFPCMANFVEVGDIANPPCQNEEGRVDYTYRIASTEVTNAEYVRFLNSVAVDKDPFNLFVPLMEQHFFGGIVRRLNDEGKYYYFCKDGYEKYPVSCVSWESAVRYCNWLHYNVNRLSDSNDSLIAETEGDSVSGAYNTSTWERNPNAVFRLPTKNEWLKAAFYDGKNWRRNTVAKGSNCYTPQGWKYPYPHLKRVKEDTESSYYGIYDFQGNLAEWIEDKTGDFRMAIGGSLIRPESFATLGEYEGDYQQKNIPSFGFRVVLTIDPDSLFEPQIFVSEENNKVDENSKYESDPNGGKYVLINYAGNCGDNKNQYKGRVNYSFYISRYELTNEQYCRFLNAVASNGDPFGLYDKNMSEGVCGGIIRKINHDTILYETKRGYENMPVTYIDYYDLARYVNWLHYGMPYGEQVIGVTEGTASQGAYNTSDFESVRTGLKKPYSSFGKRNKGALYWIPNDDEWYKAAYYNPNRLGNRKYYDYPTCSSDIPSQKMANFMRDSRLAIGEPYFMAKVDSFAEFPSFFGTLQQGGNVWEWIEDWQYGVVGNRALRGGSWQYTEYGLNALNQDPGGIDTRSYLFGGRIAKAYDENGYSPIADPMDYRLEKALKLLPLRHILIGLIVMVAIIAGLIGVVIYSVMLSKKNSAIE